MYFFSINWTLFNTRSKIYNQYHTAFKLIYECVFVCTYECVDRNVLVNNSLYLYFHRRTISLMLGGKEEE